MLLIDQNGVITHYQVEYNQSTFTEGASATNQTNGSVLSLLLVGLEEYVEYSIRVSAYTGVGQGPYSIPMFQITDEDSKFAEIIYYSFTIMC